MVGYGKDGERGEFRTSVRENFYGVAGGTMDPTNHADQLLQRRADQRLRPRVHIDRNGNWIYRAPRTGDLELAQRLRDALADDNDNRLLQSGEKS